MLKEAALKSTLTRMHRVGIDKEEIRTLYRFLMGESVDALLHLNPNFIAVNCRFNPQQMLNLVVEGVVHGLFEMHWDIVCPHCGRLADHTHRLNGIKEENYCQSCHVSFVNYADENITVTVSPHPNLFSTQPKVDNKQPDDRLKPVTALDLIGIPAFREHFSEQVPALDQSIKIRSVSVLFTDLIHSTALYSRMGDLSAYAFVKDHFDLLFNEIVAHSGGIIKTIGDAVMAVFRDAKTPIEVSFHIKEKLAKLLVQRFGDENSGIKLGISSGTALIVNMNNTLDLFGSTVNLAARIVNFADQQSVAVTPAIMADLEVQKYLAKENLIVQTLSEKLKGIPGLTDIHLLGRNIEKLEIGNEEPGT